MPNSVALKVNIRLVGAVPFVEEVGRAQFALLASLGVNLSGYQMPGHE